MGLFKKIKKKVKKVGKRVVAGVATGGLTELSRATGIAPGLPKLTESLFAPTSLADLDSGARTLTDPGNALATVLTGPNTTGTSGGTPMGGNFLGGLGGVLGTIGGFGGTAGAVANIGSSFLSGFLPAQGPVANTQTFGGGFQPTQTMAVTPIIRGAASAVSTFVGPILEKMSFAIGKNVSLRAAMIIIRRLGKFLQSPSAIAAAIGLTVGELGSLLTAASLAGSGGRRMNVGNVKALRRAHRRIKGFHKLCGDNDQLKAPRRRRSAPKITVCK